MFYSGTESFVAGTSAFIEQGLVLKEPTLVVVSSSKIDLLKAHLGRDADRVRFADMAHIGQNPARIIPAWREFVDTYASPTQRVRGIGEPIWPERTADELDECHRHEALLNVAFDGSPGWRLLCPYNTSGLDRDVLEEAVRNHPLVWEGGRPRLSETFPGVAEAGRPFDKLLSPPAPSALQLQFDAGRLDVLRAAVAKQAIQNRMSAAKTDDLVIAVHELATNSIRHGGGSGTLRIWREGDSLLCEVSDRGKFVDPLVGRQRPQPYQEGGFGMWLVNQLCNLVQIRTFDEGSLVRVHMKIVDS